MRSLFWLLAVFAAAVALVILGRIDAGYVLLIFPPYRVEVSMLFFAIARWSRVFALLYGAAAAPPRRIACRPPCAPTARGGGGSGRTRRSPARCRPTTKAAMRARRRRRHLAFEGGPAPGVAALLAARAAHQMRDFQRRDRWLERADAGGERVQTARLVSRAELALEDRDFAAAREALRSLHGARPKHIATTRMLLRASAAQAPGTRCCGSPTQLGKRDAIAPALAEEYKVQATVELLARSGDDAGAFERRWRAVAARDQIQPRVAAAAARHATALGKAQMAREILERALAAEWSPQLVALYGELPRAWMTGSPLRGARAHRARGELAARARARPRLLATLGRLCVQAALWGKARSFLEASLSFEDSRSVHLELAPRGAARRNRARAAALPARRRARLNAAAGLPERYARLAHPAGRKSWELVDQRRDQGRGADRPGAATAFPVFRNAHAADLAAHPPGADSCARSPRSAAPRCRPGPRCERRLRAREVGHANVGLRPSRQSRRRRPPRRRIFCRSCAPHRRRADCGPPRRAPLRGCPAR